MEKALSRIHLIILIIAIPSAIFMVSILILSRGSPTARSPFSCPVSKHWPVNNLPLWSRPGIAIYPDSTPLMQGVASKVFVVAAQDFEYRGSKILALDTQTGDVLW